MKGVSTTAQIQLCLNLREEDLVDFQIRRGESWQIQAEEEILMACTTYTRGFGSPAGRDHTAMGNGGREKSPMQ